MKYPLLRISKIEEYLPQMEQLEVSEISRSKRGFLYNYNIHGKKFLIRKLPIIDPDYIKGWTWDKKEMHS